MPSEGIRVAQNIAVGVQLAVDIAMLMVVAATGEVVVDMTEFAVQDMLQSVHQASMVFADP